MYAAYSVLAVLIKYLEVEWIYKTIPIEICGNIYSMNTILAIRIKTSKRFLSLQVSRGIRFN